MMFQKTKQNPKKQSQPRKQIPYILSPSVRNARTSGAQGPALLQCASMGKGSIQRQGAGWSFKTVLISLDL